jgi:hypothetical protein
MKFDARLDTRQASAFLSDRGYNTAPATLNKMRCVGGGPEFELFGRRPLYTETALLEWVRARTTRPLRSTSDLAGAARAAGTRGRAARQPVGDRRVSDSRFSGRCNEGDQ